MALYSYIPRRRAAAVSVLCTVALGLSGINLAGGSRSSKASAVSAVEDGPVASLVDGLKKAVAPAPREVGAVLGLAHGEGNPDATLPAAREPRSFYAAHLTAQSLFGPLGPGGVYLRSGDAVTPYVTIPHAGGDATPGGGLHAADGTVAVTALGKASLGALELDPDEHVLYVTNLFDRRVYQVDTWTNAVVGTLPAAPNACHDPADSWPAGLLATGHTLYLGTVCSANASPVASPVAGSDPAKLGTDVWAFDTVTKTWATSPVDLSSPDAVKAAAFGDRESKAARRAFGDRVWLDGNGDGVQGVGEGGIAGVVLHLKGTCGGDTLASVTTDADGHFSFVTPPFTAYAITVDQTNYRDGGALHGRTVVSAAGGSRADAHGCMTVAKAGRDDADHSYDMGFRPAPKSTFAVGDRVWLDANGNGRQDDGEVGVKDITVQAFNADGPVGAPAHTDAEGNYVIGSLPAGDYHLTFSGLPQGYTFTTRVAPGVPADVNSDAAADGVTATFTLKPGLPPVTDGHHARLGPCTADMIDVTIDAGIKAPDEILHRYAIGDRVWLDANHNGRQDDGETSVADVGVALFIQGGPDPVATTTTNAEGFYIFDNLPKATYFVKFTAPSGYRFTTQTAAGLANTVDSDPNAEGVTASFLLDEDEDAPNMTKGLPAGFVGSYINNTVDAGLYVPLAIGDFVWSDTNANGAQDPGEPGTAGVRVALTTPAGGPVLTAAGAEVAPVVTGTNGAYHFDNLLPGRYVVTFSNLPAGVIFSPAHAGTASTKAEKADGVSTATDSDADPATGAAAVVLPVSGGALDVVTAADGALVATFIDRTIDAGLTSGAYSIGNRVWFDENDNGTFQAGEPGLANITVGLYPVTADGTTAATPSATQVTDADGYYRFDALAAGRFVVKVESLNFAAGGHLVGFMSSKVDEVSPDADVDQNDNGVGAGAGPAAVVSGVITLGPGDSEPVNENATDLSATGQGARDARANMTVDFGFSATIDLGVEKTVLTLELGQGSTIKWRIKVSNNSNVPVVGAMVTDSIPSSVRPGSVSGPGWGCTFSGRDLTCVHDAAIPASSDSSFEVTGEVLIQNGSITNAAHVSNPRGPDAFPGNDDDEVTAIVITKVLPHTGSGIWRPMAIIADLLATLGAVMVIHDTYARRRRALGLI